MSTSATEKSIVQWIEERTGNLFGFRLTPTTQQDIIDATALAIGQKQQLVIAHQNLHGLYMALTNDSFRTLHCQPQTLIHIDGFPIVYLAWLNNLRHTKMAHRTAIHDWLPHYARAASHQQWKIYCLGSSPTVNARAVSALAELAPQAVFKGHSGFFDATGGSAENKAVIDDIVDFDADIVLVGMGMGRQEQWILNNLDQLNPRCVVAVGACLEYMAGEMSMSPRWFGPFGLEMVWRLASHPRRYAHRYLVEPWLLLGLLIKSGRLFGRHS
ncbi:MAG: WecB/TagA/CpsF family glycosyltransferase [Gammaproteobacteria bacterium]|nr:WecB/TagA/CpsF family glycosyltransferase [Gammaproteobacteria bacterium]